MEIYTNEFIGKAFEYVRDNGYDRDTTTDAVLNNWDSLTATKEDVTEFNRWVKERRTSSDYFTNLFNMITNNEELVNRWQFNTIVSAINIFFKKKREQAERDANPSTFQGQIGEKVTFTVKEAKPISYGGNYFYDSTYWRIVGTDNNVYMWSTGSYFEEGDTITGKVRDHRDYRGEKQTVITRGKVIDREPNLES